MEAVLTFSSALSSSSITLELQAQIDEVIDTLPPAIADRYSKAKLLILQPLDISGFRTRHLHIGFSLLLSLQRGIGHSSSAFIIKNRQGTLERLLRLIANGSRLALKLAGALLVSILASKRGLVIAKLWVLILRSSNITMR